MQHKYIKILLIEDDEEDALITRELIKEINTWQIDLDWVCEYDAAIEAINRLKHDVYLIDYHLGPRNGTEIVRHAVAVGCKAPKIVMTGCNARDVDLDASQSGADDFITKGTFNSWQLERTIRYALERRYVQKAMEKINAQLQQKNQELQCLALGVESAGEAIMMTSVDGIIEYINPAFTRLTGYTLDEAIGENPRFVQSGLHDNTFYRQMWQTILTGDTWTGQISNRHKNGTIYEAQLTVASVQDDEGQIQGFVSIHNNITPLKEAQAALEDANRALEKKNEKLTELTETAHRFVDNVAHDFRTPLTVVKEFSSIIADGLGGPVTSTQAEYLEFITTATRDLAQMVDDFLDSSKLRAHVLRVDRRPIQVHEIFDGARPMLQARAASKKIQLVENMPTDLVPVFADMEKVERVIANLTINAIKFSSTSSEIKLWATETDTGDVRIGITDHGPGLAPDDLAVIFERFKQVGDVQRASTKGFGLGLNIAKELIWLNLGTVHVESKWGCGSTFSFTLPPCDRSAILNCYFHRLAELDEPPENITVFRIHATEPGADLEEVRLFFASMCYSMDLVLPEPDNESVIVIGSTNEPEKWIKRLQAERESKIRNTTKVKLPALCIQLLGRVVCPEIKDASILSTVTQFTELRSSTLR